MSAINSTHRKGVDVIQDLRVGDLVRLKVACLNNDKGTVGVVFYDYGDGVQVIFPNGHLDGFSKVHKMPDGETETEFFFSEKVGHAHYLDGYQFRSVIITHRDFDRGLFVQAFKEGGD